MTRVAFCQICAKKVTDSELKEIPKTRALEPTRRVCTECYEEYTRSR